MRLLTGIALAIWPPIAWGLFWVLKHVGALFYSDFMLAWYSFNHWLISSAPLYGKQIDAVLQSDYSNGDIAFWVLWYGILLLLWPTRWVWQRGFWYRVALTSVGVALATAAFIAAWPVVGPILKPFLS